MKNILFSILLVFIVACTNTNKIESNTKEKPNIIIILADDMGYSDLGCTGSEINTPNLDKLANNGALFTNFYNTSRCCPSRASILTGQYQWDAGMGHMDYTKSQLPEYQGYLNKKSITIAEALKLGGYQTFMSGKWHVGHKEREMWPDYRGFDQFYGTPAGGGIYYYPSKHYKRDVFWNGKKIEPDSTWYSTDAFTDYAIDYIENKKEDKKPFFMYLAYIAPHFPLQAKPEDIEKYKGVYDIGYEEIRKSRFEKQKKIGVVPERAQLPKAEVKKWKDVKNKEQEARKMEVYAAMVDNMDQNIGRLITSLKEEGVYDNTIIFFLSDNGACQSDFNRTPNEEIGTRFSNATYGKWYNVSNTPYRKHKRMEHEGGIKTPMIMHWPQGVKANMKINSPAHITDFMKVCLDIAEVNYPKKYDNVELDELDGVSFLPLLTGKDVQKDRIFYWEHEGNKAIRIGDWKLVTSRKGKWELYNLKRDPFELNNLSRENLQMKDEILKEYDSWAKKHGVQSWPLKKIKK